MTRYISFFTLYLLVYGGMHLYLLWRIRGAWGLRWRGTLAVLALLGLMVAAPPLARVLDAQGGHPLMLQLSLSGYLWMAFAFLWFSLLLCTDLYRTTLHHTPLCRTPLGRRLPLPAARRVVGGAAALALALSVYGWFEARDIGLEEIHLTSEKLPADAPPLRLVQISDTHFGELVGAGRLERMLAVVRTAHPDLVVATGDVVDSQLDHLNALMERLTTLEPPLGKFAVTGNHEFYRGVDASLGFLRRAGFRVLRGEALEVGGVVLAGVDDPAAERFGVTAGMPEEALLVSLPAGRYRILLKHQPRDAARGAGGFDLQLSGHLHQGQIFPFTLLVKLVHRVPMGLSSLGKGSLLYVSRGTGTWGPPVRLLAPPEVTLFVIQGTGPGTSRGTGQGKDRAPATPGG